MYKKLILAITTHGKVTISNIDDAEPHTFIFPEGIKMTKLNVSAYGECNIMDEDQVDSYIGKIRKNMKSLLSPKLSAKKFRSLSEEFHKTDTSFLKNIKYQYNDLKNKSDEDALTYKGYLNGFDRSYTIETKSAGDITLNKYYVRTNADVKNNDWKIKAINMPGEPDILSCVGPQTREGSSKITLENLINMLRQYGVTEVIIFDFSCSDIGDDALDIELGARATRAHRRAFLSKHKPNYIISKNKTAKLRRSARLKKRAAK